MFNTGAATVKGAWDDADQFTGTNPWYVLKQKLASGEYTRYWDPESHVPYLYSKTKQEFLTYDDPQSIDEKVDYILDQGFGGAILWDISGDTPEHELGNIVKEVKNTPLPDDSDVPVPDEDPVIDKTDLKAILVSVDDGQTRVYMNLDSSKITSGTAYTAYVDGKYLFGTEGTHYYYSNKKSLGKEASFRTGDVESRLAVGSVISVKREYPNQAVLGQITVTQDMLDGNNPVISDGSVKSMSVSKINNVPYIFVDFDKEKLHSADGSSYVAKIVNDSKRGNYIFNCDNGKCDYSTETVDGAISHVKSDEKDISIGETIVIQRVSPNPAVVAQMVVTSFEPEPQPEPQPEPVTGLKVTLFQNAGYTGDSLEVTGDIDCLNGVKMKNGTDADDQVSSFTIPESSLGVRLFTECQFKGTSNLFPSSSQYDLTRYLSEMNKAVSSVQVVKAEAREASYDRGGFLQIYGDIPRLSAEKMGDYRDTYDNVISQIEVAEGYTVRLYSERDYQGSYVDVKSGQKIPDLSAVSFDNKASSLKVFIDKAK